MGDCRHVYTYVNYATWILLTWLSRYRDNITISIMLLSSLNIDSSAKTIEIYKYIMHNISLKIAKYL